MIFPYRTGSNSAKALAARMEMKRIKRENSGFKGHSKKLVVNWGAKAVSNEVKKCKILNDPVAVELASNKLSFFQHVYEELSVPEFTTDKGAAFGWIEDGKTVVVREVLSGHSGQGIVLLEDEKDFDRYDHNKAKMYVKYIPKKQEYRVHVVGNKAVDVRRKALKVDVDRNVANWKIRNYDNGFIFSKDGFETPQDVIDQSIKACQLCNLDFGAVDVVFNDFQQRAYVIEINTAPGLEGSTVENYSDAFTQLFERHHKVSEYGDIPDDLYKKYLRGDLTLENLISAYEKVQKEHASTLGKHVDKVYYDLESQVQPGINEAVPEWGE